MNRSPVRPSVCFSSAVVAFVLCLVCIALAPRLALSDTPLPQGVPQSCGIQLKSHNFTVQTLDRVHALGFRVVRRGLYWSSVEKEKGVYSFTEWDEPMRHANKLGLTVVGVLFGGNKLYEDDQGGIQTEAARVGFANFAAATAKRYKDQTVIWEIWNEPNVRTFWRKSGTHNSAEFAAEYSELVKAVAPAMLKANPDCFIVAGSVSNYWEPSYAWTEHCFKNGVLKSGIRGWSTHPYGVSTPEEFAVGHARTRELLKKYGAPEMPLLDTERGFAVKEAAEGWSGGSQERAREFQAWHLVRQYLVDQLCGVPVTVWYEWDGAEFGLADKSGPRPALKAFEVMAAQLGGYKLVQRLKSDSERDYLLLFENKAGQRKLVAWTAPPPGGAPDEAKEHVIALETDVSFAVAGLAGDTEKVASGIPLTLTGAPQYVDLPANVKLVGSRTLRATAAPAATTANVEAAPEGSVDLKLFAEGAEWKFVKNTGDGSFELAKGDAGAPVGVLQFDFSKSTSTSWPYVMAETKTRIAEGAREVRLNARSAIPQQLTFRLVDSTGQTHQFKTRITEAGQWQTVTIPLARKLEHWDGANDGKIHFPIAQIVLSLPAPKSGEKTGKVEFAEAVAVMGGGSAATPTKPAAAKTTSAKPTTTKPAPAAPATSSGAPATGPAADKLLTAGEWKFLKNTGNGSFELAKGDDGEPVGVLSYDFTKSKSKSTPYVLAEAAVTIPEARQLQLAVRSKVAQPLTFRVIDATGQNHQFKARIQGAGEWETIRIPLTKRLEHWGGANDGKIHFPVSAMIFSVPLPGDDAKQGKVEYARIKAGGDDE